SITIGATLLLSFFVSLWLSHKAKQTWQQQSKSGWVNSGLYAVIRHPDYGGIILMNLAFFFIFRTWWLLPMVLFFIWLWSREARYEEQEMLAKHGDPYVSYIRDTGRFFPRLFKRKE
ncbi:methyltransferase family protein, partial [Chloroflexota bacterium]